jgi:L-lactate utilization protein LutC
MSPRDAMLKRIRDAVIKGNSAGHALALPARGHTGYQGAGGDPLNRFVEQLAVAGGVAHLVHNQRSAVAKVLEIAKQKNATRVLLGCGPVLDPLDLERELNAGGLDVIAAAETDVASRDAFFSADVAISGVAYLIAETGSIVVATRRDEPRSVSLLPPVHIAIASAGQVLPDLFDLFETLQGRDDEDQLPSCVAVITGPSKTGDIELKLVTGVHGPGEVHVVLLATDGPNA